MNSTGWPTGKRILPCCSPLRMNSHNNAVVLKDLLDGMRKPPTGTGPGAARSLHGRQAKRMQG